MGSVNILSKPEAESFKYSFVEDENGKLVKVSFDNIKKLLNYISADDESDIVSFMEAIDGGIKVTMKDGTSFGIPISQAKEFESVEYDKDTCYLHFYDADGQDVYPPVYIEGSSGGGTASSSIVKLTNQNGTASMTVAAGKAANLMFNFTSTEDDIPTGNGVCQIIVNGALKATFNVEQGLTTVDVSEYLTSGSNTVRVTCTDVYGNYKTLAYTVAVVDLYITSTFDATVAYTGDITFKYTPYGAIDKTIHILIDGTEKATADISTSGKQTTYLITALAHGVHRIELYATAELEDASLESEHLIYDVICTEAGNTSPMIASVYTVTAVKQGAQVSIPYVVYDPTKLACDISLDIYTMGSGSEVLYSTQSLTVDRSQNHWNTRNYPIGTVYFRIKYGDITKVHTVEVAESDIQTEPETNDLELALTSDGRSNNEPDPAVWSYGDYATEFTDFNWRSNGWAVDDNGDTCLRLNDNARAEIKFKPFVNDIRTYGKTIELEFAIRDVNSRDDVVISCMAGGIGFEVKADTAYLTSEQSRVFCNYKDEEKVKLTFTVEARSEYRQLSVYLNGILSDVVQYPDSDNFQQSNAVNISIGSSKCGIDVYTIRSYSTALTAPTNVDNFIADTDDIVEKTKIYERNDIYDEYGNISFEKCKAKNSVMVIIGDLPQSKGDKKTVKVQYMDIDDPSINYLDEAVTIDVQGTSSQYYVRKNWKLKFSENRHIDKEHLPASVICIKVDYAEATGTHNTQNANFVETLYSEPIPPQAKDPKCRTTIYGKPILLFHQKDAGSDPVFYGKANYNYDKGAEYVFGFTSEYDVECWEFKNNTSAPCNFLGPITTNWEEDFEARYPDGNKTLVRLKAMHDWVVSTKDDLDKFKAEFEEHFDMHYCLIYYVYTFFALMVDQRAKNMFLTYWGATGKWQPWFYDNDTSFGINNEGQLVFDYYHEDIDQLDGANVYNGQNSVLWSNFRQAFPDEIKETYQHLRNNGFITYDKLIDRFITQGSDKWSESIYNEDGDFKYISMLRSENDATNLPQVRGSGEEHFRYFIENRLNYCDSKWYASDYANDYISLRIYTPTTWSGVAPNPAITVTPFSDMYAGVRYKANGTLYQERATHGVPVTFSPEGETFESENNESFNDTETAVYGAHQLSSIGDLAPLYCGSINVANADKLIELKVGDATEGYSNANLRELSVGTNKLLKKIDVRNCPNFSSVLGLANCPGIEEVYATGTAITGVEFPESGCLRIAQLPATIANLTIKHQLYIEQLSIAGYDAIKTLWIENCPTIDGFDILTKSPNVERLRLTDVDLKYDTAAEMLALAARTIGGIDENGVNADKMWIDGKCHIKALTGDELAAVKEAFPYLTITYDALTSYLIYKSEDGTTELGRQAIQNGGDGSYSGTTPTKSSTAQYTYTFAGWSLTPGGAADASALKNVEADRVVYAAFTSTLRSYTVRFYNGTTLLQTSTVQYGGTATYTGSTPENTSTGNVDDFEFSGWKPAPTNIQGNTDCYAQYYDLREITDSWATIAAAVADGTAESKYSVGATKMLDIGAKDLPYAFYRASAVVYNNEIHILGSYDSANRTAHYKWNGSEWVSVSTLPYEFFNGSGIVYNGEIHILGGEYGNTNHYKWDGSAWTSVSTLPHPLYLGGAVVYNDEIHILGNGTTAYNTAHYKWDGSNWTSMSTLPYSFSVQTAVVYNHEIHIMGSTNVNTRNYHYKWNPTDGWVSAGTLPYKMQNGIVVVCDNEIHIMGSYYDPRSKHYRYDGNKWTYTSALPYELFEGSGIVYNGEIHILGGSSNKSAFYYFSTEESKWKRYVTESIPMQIVAHNHDELASGVKWEGLGQLPHYFYLGSCVDLNGEIHILGCGNSNHNTKHYKYDGAAWTSVSTLPNRFSEGSAVVCNGEIHILGCNNSSYYTIHYKWDGTSWTSVSTLPYNFYQGAAVVYNNEIHIFGGSTSTNRTNHYKWTGTEWVSVSTLPYSFVRGDAVVYNNEIHLLGSYSSTSYYTAHYKYDGSTWTSVSTLPYNFYNGSAVVYNNEIHIFGGMDSSAKRLHYKWNGTEWAEVYRLPFDFYDGCAIVYDGNLTVVGNYPNSDYRAFRYLNTDHPKATLTFLAKNLLAEARVYSAASTDFWSSSDLRAWLNGDFLTSLPSDLQTVISEVNKISNAGSNLVTTQDKCFIPSSSEIGLTIKYTPDGQGTAYSVFTDDASRNKATTDGVTRTWWTRSKRTDSSNVVSWTAYGFDSAYSPNDKTVYILIGFCI